MTKEEARSSVMGAISMALKDPTLQQGFEIICKNLSDLEAKNAKLQAKIDDWQSEYIELENLKNNEIADLEKENAELKEKLNFSTQYYQGQKAKEQLTQAKEIIRDFLSVTIDYIDKEDKNYPLIEQAERFLKELEK